MGFRYVIFDLDGTLIDSCGDIAAGVNAAREALGYAPLEVETVRGFIGDGLDVLISRVVRAEDRAGATEVYRAHYAEHLVDRTRVYRGVERLLEDLERDGCLMAVVSNKPGDYSRTILERLSLARHFGAVVGGDGPSGRKPSAGPFEEALRGIGGVPEEALVVGDGPNDVLGARAAGLRVCGVTYGIGSADALWELGPDYLAATPEEVLEVVRRGAGGVP